jgi:hypothetical protein
MKKDISCCPNDVSRRLGLRHPIIGTRTRRPALALRVVLRWPSLADNACRWLWLSYWRPLMEVRVDRETVRVRGRGGGETLDVEIKINTP